MMHVHWCNLYKQFDLQAQLLVAVKPNEILEKTSKMLVSALEENNSRCDLVALCMNELLSVVNYDSLHNGKLNTCIYI